MTETKTTESLYDRLGGAFAIAAVVDRFSDQLIVNSKVGKGSKNKQLNEWSTNKLDRLPGLKFMRTLWVCDIAGGPQKFAPTKAEPSRLNLQNAHCPFQINSDEFDEVAKELANALDYFHVPEKEKNEVLAAFKTHKSEVTEGSKSKFCPFINIPPLT